MTPMLAHGTFHALEIAGLMLGVVFPFVVLIVVVRTTQRRDRDR